MGDNSFIPIKDMTNEHIQRALFFTENKIVEWDSSLKVAKQTKELFIQKREELIRESLKRNLHLETLKGTDEKYDVIMELPIEA